MIRSREKAQRYGVSGIGRPSRYNNVAPTAISTVALRVKQ
jgi:hypothetical protein